MKRIALFTANRALAQKVKLILRDIASVEVLTGECNADGYDAVFIDCESFDSLPYHGIFLDTPLLHTELIRAVNESDARVRRTLKLKKDNRCAILADEEIKLTEVEYKLLDALLSAAGYVDRKTLLRHVWGDSADAGVVNVYVHYLREKLERSGERIILSSRKEGYRIDEKYLGRE